MRGFKQRNYIIKRVFQEDYLGCWVGMNLERGRQKVGDYLGDDCSNFGEVREFEWGEGDVDFFRRE